MKPFIDECGIIHIAYMATATFLSKEVVTTSGEPLVDRSTHGSHADKSSELGEGRRRRQWWWWW